MKTNFCNAAVTAFPLVIALVFCPGLVWAEQIFGVVVGISDGDTITVLDANNAQHKIRLMGIDAPEKKQAFGNRAKQKLSYWLYDKTVLVEHSKRDRYGRIIGTVWVSSPDACPNASPDCPKTLDAGLALVSVGLAWHYKQYEREQTAEDRERYAFAEVEARARRSGLWSDAAPVPPWDWRRLKRPKQ